MDTKEGTVAPPDLGLDEHDSSMVNAWWSDNAWNEGNDEENDDDDGPPKSDVLGVDHLQNEVWEESCEWDESWDDKVYGEDGVEGSYHNTTESWDDGVWGSFWDGSWDSESPTAPTWDPTWDPTWEDPSTGHNPLDALDTAASGSEQAWGGDEGWTGDESDGRDQLWDGDEGWDHDQSWDDEWWEDWPQHVDPNASYTYTGVLQDGSAGLDHGATTPNAGSATEAGKGHDQQKDPSKVC